MNVDHSRGLEQRYGALLGGCRLGLIRGLSSAPERERLIALFGRGKQLRPLLALLSHAVAGGDPRAALNAAQALELLHVASLIHDDVIDGSATRRGLPSLHAEVGIHRALVAGDFLLARAFEVLAEGPLPAERTLCAVRELSHCAQRCCRGQAGELQAHGRHSSASDYLLVTREKTASLFEASVVVGALLGEARRTEIESLREFAIELGIAFQISDDLRDRDQPAAPLEPTVVASMERMAAALAALAPSRARDDLETFARLALQAIDVRPMAPMPHMVGRPDQIVSGDQRPLGVSALGY